MAAGIPFAAVTRWPSWLRCSAMVLLLGSTLPSLSRTGMVCALLALVLSLTLLRTDIGPQWRVGTLAGLGAAGAVGLSRLLEVFARAGREQSGSAAAGDAQQVRPVGQQFAVRGGPGHQGTADQLRDRKSVV